MRTWFVGTFALLLVGCPKPEVKADDAGAPPVTVLDAAAPAVTAAAIPDAGAPAVTVTTATATATATHSAVAPSASHSAAGASAKPSPKAAAYTCKSNEIDVGDGCVKRCETDKDCAKPMKCQAIMVGNPNGGSSTALGCEKP